MTNTDTETGWKPPYLPYGTLVGFIEKKLAGDIPPRIDRGFLENYSGSVQFLLTNALKTIGFIGDDLTVTPALKRAAQNPDQRKAVLREWAEVFYKDEIALATQAATAQMLHESFAKKGPSGSVLRKAVVFYLSLTDDLALPKSAFFKAPKQAGGAAAPKPRAAATAKKAAGSAAPKPGEQNGHGDASKDREAEIRTVQLGDAGTVTLKVDVRWLDLDDDTFVKLRKFIRDIEALGGGEAP